MRNLQTINIHCQSIPVKNEDGRLVGKFNEIRWDNANKIGNLIQNFAENHYPNCKVKQSPFESLKDDYAEFWIKIEIESADQNLHKLPEQVKQILKKISGKATNQPSLFNPHQAEETDENTEVSEAIIAESNLFLANNGNVKIKSPIQIQVAGTSVNLAGSFAPKPEVERPELAPISLNGIVVGVHKKPPTGFIESQTNKKFTFLFELTNFYSKLVENMDKDKFVCFKIQPKYAADGQILNYLTAINSATHAPSELDFTESQES